MNVWPVGIILIRLLTGFHLFLKEETNMEQLVNITDYLGRPTDREIFEVTEYARRYACQGIRSVASAAHGANLQYSWQFEYWMNAARSPSHSLRSL